MKELERAHRPWYMRGEVALALLAFLAYGLKERDANIRVTYQLVGGECLASGVEVGMQGLIWTEGFLPPGIVWLWQKWQ